jgi:hypothetical protein
MMQDEQRLRWLPWWTVLEREKLLVPTVVKSSSDTMRCRVIYNWSHPKEALKQCPETLEPTWRVLTLLKD